MERDLKLKNIVEAVREIAESVESASWNGLTKRVEDVMFPVPPKGECAWCDAAYSGRCEQHKPL